MKTPILPLIGLATLLAVGLIHCTAAWGQFLPPEEFDRPFNGRILIQEARGEAELRKLCPPKFVPNFPVLGCSYQFDNLPICGIVKVPDDQIRAAGHDPDIFMRHEIGHCNGWPGTHKGAR